MSQLCVQFVEPEQTSRFRFHRNQPIVYCAVLQTLQPLDPLRSETSDDPMSPSFPLPGMQLGERTIVLSTPALDLKRQVLEAKSYPAADNGSHHVPHNFSSCQHKLAMPRMDRLFAMPRFECQSTSI